MMKLILEYEEETDMLAQAFLAIRRRGCYGPTALREVRRLMKSFKATKLIYKSLIAMICMLSTSSAMALSYFIVDGYENTPLCHAVKDALSKGMVMDAERPLCERRFELLPQAKSLGLSGVEKTLLSPTSYMDLWLKMAQLDRQEPSLPMLAAARPKNEKMIAKNMSTMVNKIYVSHFDADNSGIIQKIYIEDSAFCSVKDSYADSSVRTFIEKSNGTLDLRWGPHASTAGIPFIYKEHTYYLKWQSLKGSPDKKMKAQLDVFDAVPFKSGSKYTAANAGFTPSYCRIYSYQTR